MHQVSDSQRCEPYSDKLSRNQLRKQLRQKRQTLSFEEQQCASEYLALNLLHNPDLNSARHIAIYLPNDGEISPLLFMNMAKRKHIHFYLPVLHPILPGRLVFSPYHDGVELKANRFGIPEPSFKNGLKRPVWALDAVLLPLVGFDDNGGRLGMGGGFYDRTFAFSRLRPRLAPKLIGIAHDFQRVNKLPIEPWDIPLNSVVTDRDRYRLSRSLSI